MKELPLLNLFQKGEYQACHRVFRYIKTENGFL